MKYTLTILLFVFLFSCGNQNEETETDLDTLTSVKDSIDIETVEKDSVQHADLSGFDFLLNIAKANQHLKDSLELYLSIISGEINKQSQIEHAFEIRKNIKQDLETVVFHYLTDQQTDYDKTLEEELNKVGFQGVYAEGMFQVLDIAPVLEKEIELHGSEKFKLKIKFQNAFASSLGSEYPFDTMSDEAEVVKIGEEIMNTFPNSGLYNEIKEKFMRHVSYFTDFHTVTMKNQDNPAYIVGGLGMDMYPSVSYRSNFESYIKEFPKSRYTPVIQKILDNPSTISSNRNENIYLVVVHFADKSEEAENMIFDFLNQGADIPHNIPIKDGDKRQYAVVYRFFTDHDTAIRALQVIMDDHPFAEIIEVDRGGNIQ